MLEGVRVVDLSPSVAGQYAARLFAAYGADVVKVEPPRGDPLRYAPRPARLGPDGGVLFAYLNSAKRSLVLEPEDGDGRRLLDRLLRTADAVFESSLPGSPSTFAPDLGQLMRDKPSLVVCSITPYGRTGPRSRWRSTSLTALASGGQLMLTGEPDREPLQTAGHQAYYQGGLHGFASALAGLYAARRTGCGDHIDISIQEAQAIALEGAGPSSMVRGVDSERMGNQLHAALGMYPCADGYVSVAALQRQMRAVFRCIGQPELFDDPRFHTAQARRVNNDLLRAIILAWTLERTADQIVAEAAAADAPFTYILTPREVLEWGPLHERGYWHEVTHPVLGRYSLPAGPVSIDGDRGRFGRAPLLGEHTAELLDELGRPDADQAGSRRGEAGDASLCAPERLRPPLAGVRVLDLTAVWSGPLGTRLIAEMGADVIKVEGPKTPDAVRFLVTADLADRAYNRVPYFNEYNRRKRAIALDLSDPRGKALFLRLAACADVVIENWRADVIDLLGLGYAALQAVNPEIILVSMPGFAESGPEALLPGYGSLIESMAGLVAAQGYEDGSPQKSGVSYGDPVAGVTAAAAVSLALLRREISGHGSRVIVPQRDAIIGLIGEFVVAEAIGDPLPLKTGNHHPDFCPHNVYRARDDSGRMQANAGGEPIDEFHDTWLAIAVEDDDAWLRLRQVVGDLRLDDPEYTTAAGRKAAEPAIDAVLASWVRPQDAGAAAAALQSAGVAASAVLSPLMLVHDEHLAARGFYTSCDHPEAGHHTCTVPNWRFSRHPLPPSLPSPCFAQHNHAVLAELLGLAQSEFDQLLDAGVIAEVPANA